MRNLQNTELISQFKTLVASERKITSQVLQFIAEIDRRRLYLDLAYGSLYDFLVKGHGYSNGAAMRRIEAARLLREIPEVASQIQSGAVSLSQLSIIQRAAKEHRKETGQRLEPARKKELLLQIEGITQSQTEALVRTTLQIALPKIQPKPVYHRDESVTLTITLSKEQMVTVEKARQLLAHVVPGGEWPEVFEHLCRKEVEKRTVSKGHSAVAIKKQLLNKEACCQYVDMESGKKCDSTLRLELEHIRPRWAGGSDDAENLTILCAQHNRHRYRKPSNQRPSDD